MRNSYVTMFRTERHDTDVSVYNHSYDNMFWTEYNHVISTCATSTAQWHE